MGNAYCCKRIPLPESEKKDEIQSAHKGFSTRDIEKSKGKEIKETSTQENMSQLQQNITNIDRHYQETTSPALPQQEKCKLNGPDNEDLTASIIKVQKCVRAKQAREAYNTSIKHSLYQSQMEVINKQNMLYSNLKEAEAKVTTESYDKTGWKEFYPPQTDFFNFDYGEVTEKQVMVVPPPPNSQNKEESYYTGQVNRKNERHGFGILSNSKTKYEGFWRNNLFTGWGRETTLNGNILEGKFIAGKLSGKGKLMNNKGETFTGDFENGKKKGTGKEITKQFAYEGTYDDNTMNGKGTIQFFEEKNKYIGDFFNNELTGTGTYIWDSGERYEGTLIKGNYHGRGVFTWPDGQVYEGEYINGIKEGQGKMTYPNGNIYEGPYVNGYPHGIGKYTKKGKTVNVEFNKGTFVKITK